MNVLGLGWLGSADEEDDGLVRVSAYDCPLRRRRSCPFMSPYDHGAPLQVMTDDNNSAPDAVVSAGTNHSGAENNDREEDCAGCQDEAIAFNTPEPFYFGLGYRRPHTCAKANADAEAPAADEEPPVCKWNSGSLELVSPNELYSVDEDNTDDEGNEDDEGNADDEDNRDSEDSEDSEDSDDSGDELADAAALSCRFLVTLGPHTCTNDGFLMQRRVRLVTDQNIVPELPQQAEGFPMRKWSVSVYILDEDGEQHPADCFQRVVFNLHPSFENPTQTFNTAPFTCENVGWGEFEMTIDMYTTEKSKQTIPHDLNFQSNHYETEHTVSFKNPSQALQQILRQTGPLPNDEDRNKRKSGAGPKKGQKYDFEKLAEGLGRLEEDDLLRVIQMITDQRTDSMYIKSEPDSGEFSVDLYSMPDKLVKDLWEFLAKKNLVA